MSTRLLQAVCQSVVESLVSQTSGIDSAAIVTGDGFEVADPEAEVAGLFAGEAGRLAVVCHVVAVGLGRCDVRER